MLEYCEVVQHKQPFYRSPNPEVRLLLCLTGAPRPFLEPWSNIMCHLSGCISRCRKDSYSKGCDWHKLSWLKKENKIKKMQSLIRDGALALTVENVVLNEQGLNLSQLQMPAFPCTAGLLPMLSGCCPFAAAMCLGSVCASTSASRCVFL